MLLPIFGMAQLTEIGGYGGVSNFVGDVGNGFIPKGYSAGIIYRFQFDERYSIRAQAMFGKVSANDADASSDFKVNRNLTFESDILEVAIMGEFNFFEFITGSKKKSHSPYIFGGVGVFKFNPTAVVNGEYFELQPLGTEGQGTSLSSNASYGLWGLSLPFGLGYRFTPADNISFSFEIGFRNTTTDYLDDVGGYYVNVKKLENASGVEAAYFSDRSITETDKTGTMRGDSRKNDWYVFSGVSLFVALTPKGERCKRF